MPTSKTIKIQKNKILTYSINKTGYQTVNKSLVVTENTSINEDLTPTTGNPILYLSEDHHDRIFDCATFFMYFTPSGTYDVDSLKYVSAKQTTGSGLTNIQVVKELWLAQVETALSVETPKGTSKDFVFTFNGTTWDLTGATTVSGISATDLGDVYGISFAGTATSGDVITVVETQYNKFACYILDSNYRNDYGWGSNVLIMPKQYGYPLPCIESANYYNDYIKNNTVISNYPIFNYCKNLGNFILPNSININALVPNGEELQSIYNNRVILDSFDPIIQGGSISFNLTNWAFNEGRVWSCLENVANGAWRLSGSWEGGTNFDKRTSMGCIPIFEVPVM